MNLKYFVGRMVVVQFKQPWLVIDSQERRPIPVEIRDPRVAPVDEPAAAPATAPLVVIVPSVPKPPERPEPPKRVPTIPLFIPFLRGRVVEKEGCFLFEYMSDREPNTKLELMVSDDMFHSIAAVTEDRASVT